MDSLVPFESKEVQVAGKNGTMMATAVSREIANVQGKIFMAKQFPRDEMRAMERIKTACGRVGLASQAIYSFKRGDTMVTGPSIRLAETLSQNWGNMDSGIRELEQKDNESVVESYAWDLETNSSSSKIFTVSHIRHTKYGDKKLTDPRDIYENNANQGARRLRACILSLIPGDVVDMAVEACEQTLKSSTKNDKDTRDGLLKAFAEYGVTEAMISERIGQHFGSITVSQIIEMRKIYSAILDGIAKPDEFFDFSVGKGQSGNKKAEDQKKADQKIDQKVDADPLDAALGLLGDGGL